MAYRSNPPVSGDWTTYKNNVLGGVKYTRNPKSPENKDLGLSAHKLYDGPMNKFTGECDPHFKVTYLLLKRDL